MTSIQSSFHQIHCLKANLHFIVLIEMADNYEIEFVENRSHRLRLGDYAFSWLEFHPIANASRTWTG